MSSLLAGALSTQFLSVCQSCLTDLLWVMGAHVISILWLCSRVDLKGPHYHLVLDGRPPSPVALRVVCMCWLLITCHKPCPFRQKASNPAAKALALGALPATSAVRITDLIPGMWFLYILTPSLSSSHLETLWEQKGFRAFRASASCLVVSECQGQLEGRRRMFLKSPWLEILHT